MFVKAVRGGVGGVMNAKLLARYKQSITASEDKAGGKCEASDVSDGDRVSR